MSLAIHNTRVVRAVGGLFEDSNYFTLEFTQSYITEVTQIVVYFDTGAAGYITDLVHAINSASMPLTQPRVATPRPATGRDRNRHPLLNGALPC